MKKVKGLVVFSAAATLLALVLEQKVEARVHFRSCKEAWLQDMEILLVVKKDILKI